MIDDLFVCDVLTGDSIMHVIRYDATTWEVYHYGTLPNGRTAVRHRIVDLLSYDLCSKSFCADYLEPYGFESLDEFRKVYGWHRWQCNLAVRIFQTELAYAEIICTGTRKFCEQFIERRNA